MPHGGIEVGDLLGKKRLTGEKMATTVVQNTQGAYDGFDRVHKMIRATFKITLTGSYVTGGDPVDLSGIAPAGCSRPPMPGTFGLASVNPAAAGAIYFYVAGTTLQNGKLQVLTGAIAELSAGAYPAAQLADIIVCSAFFVYGGS
jgi:hypothetical protein